MFLMCLSIAFVSAHTPSIPFSRNQTTARESELSFCMIQKHRPEDCQSIDGLKLEDCHLLDISSIDCEEARTETSDGDNLDSVALRN